MNQEATGSRKQVIGCRPVVDRVQRFVNISGLAGSGLLDVIEEVILTFKCGNNADVVCFQRLINEDKGTYLASPNGKYAIFERVIGPDGRILSILSSRDVEDLGIVNKGEGVKYVCLDMKVEANRLYTVAFRLHKPTNIIKSPTNIIMPYYDIAFTDYIVDVNMAEEQSQYIQVLHTNDHLRFKVGETEGQLRGRIYGKIGWSMHKYVTLTSRGIAYTFKINPTMGDTIVNYYFTLSEFYKLMLIIMMLSIFGIMGLSILMAARFISPSLVLPVITTLVLVLISGYITIPKDSVIKYRGINMLTIIALITLIVSVLIAKI